MRVLSIAGGGLASLAKPFRLDLGAGVLGSAGLFAITGATGAGKSTILDALCLALYGVYPRIHDSEAASAKFTDASGEELRADDPRTILSRGSGMGFAEVDFIGVDGERYRARWSVRRAREKADSRLQKAEHTVGRVLPDGSAPPVTRTLNETKEEIARAAGLSFEQFCRTVLLAQNRFAAFLEAKDGDRAALLDRITNTGIYRILSQKAHERYAQQQRAVEALEQRRRDIGLLPDDERQQIASECALRRAEAAELEQRHAALAGELKRHDDATHAEEALARAVEKCANAERAVEAAEAERVRHARLKTAEGLRPLRAHATRTDADVGGAQCALDEAHRARAAAQESLQASAAERRCAEEALGAAEQTVQALAPQWERAAELDAAVAAARDECAKAQEALAAAESDGAQKRAAAAALARDLAQARERLGRAIDRRERQAQLRPLAECWSDVLEHLGKRRELVASRKRLADRRQDCERNIERLGRAVAQLRERHARAVAQCAELREQIDARQRALHAIDEPLLRTQEKTLGALVALSATLAQWAGAWSEAERRRAAAQSAAGGAAAALAQATQDEAAAAQELATLQAKRRELQPFVDLAAAAETRAAADLRSKLVDGQPCPVCGATEHRSHAPEIEALARQIRERRAELDAAITGAEKAAMAAAAAVANARAQQQAALRAGEEAGQAMAQAAAAYERACGDFVRIRATGEGSIPADAPPAQPDGAGARLAEIDRRLADAQADVERRIQQAAGLRKECDSLRARADALARDAETSLREREADERALAQQQIDLAETLTEARNVDERIASIDREWGSTLAAAGVSQTDLDRDPDAACRRLEQQSKEFASIVREAEALDQSIRALQPQLAAAEAAAAAAANTIACAQEERRGRDAALNQARAMRAGLLGGEDTAAHRRRYTQAQKAAMDALSAAQARFNGCEVAAAQAEAAARAAIEALARASDAQEQARAALATALEAAGLSDAELTALLAVPPGETAALGSRLKALDEALATARGEQAARQSDLEQALAAGRPERQRAEIEAAIADASAAIANMRELIGSLQNRLAMDDAARRRDAELGGELDAAKARLKIWAEVHAAIGSADGAKFMRFAQRITLAHLVHLANQHLARLAPRYRLERSAGETLGLQVVDRDMGDERRSTVGLSGGEKFLTSLALALALSSLEGTKNFVDTLFIDEGFGSLDAEHVDVAIDALERLSSDRKVGVISHVEKMHERILVQVRVERRAGGTSVVRIEGAGEPPVIEPAQSAAA